MPVMRSHFQENTKLGHFTFQFKGHQRNAPKRKTHVQNDCFSSLNIWFCGVPVAGAVLSHCKFTRLVVLSTPQVIEGQSYRTCGTVSRCSLPSRADSVNWKIAGSFTAQPCGYPPKPLHRFAKAPAYCRVDNGIR